MTPSTVVCDRTRVRATARQSVLAALACVLAMLVSAAPAAAAPAWLAPVDLSAADRMDTLPQVAVDAQGNAVAVWQRSDGASSTVRSAVRLAGGAWQAPVDVSVTGAGALDLSPRIAVNAQGDAVAVWRRFDGTAYIVQASLRPAGGAWQAPVNLSATGGDAGEAQVAVDAQGNAVAVWQRSDATNSIVQGSVRPAGGSWQPTVNLSPADGHASEPQVDVDGQGNAVAVWLRFNGRVTVVQGSARPAGATWQTAANLSEDGQYAGGPRLAVDAQGNAAAVWQSRAGSNDRVQGSVRPAGGSWQTSTNLSASGENAFHAQVAVDPLGNAVAVWTRVNGARFVVQGSVRPAGASWQPPANLSAAGQSAGNPKVAVDARGNAVAVWLRVDGEVIVQGSVRPAGGAWQPVADLSATGANASEAQVAVDPQGNAVAVWQRGNATAGGVQGAGYDAVGPSLRALSVPASGVAGQRLSFAVSPFDVWSALGATSWTFGDGATATGTAVTHTYDRAGTFTVGVGAADALANSTSATRTITIAPAPAPPLVVRPALPQPRQAPPRLAAVSGLRLSPGRLRARRPGTRVSYRLNVAASVRFTLQRATRGRRVGRRCVRQTPRNRGRGRSRSCTRLVTVGGAGFTRTRPAGADRFTFTARIAGRALPPGRYRLTATPTADNRAGTPGHARLLILPASPKRRP